MSNASINPPRRIRIRPPMDAAEITQVLDRLIPHAQSGNPADVVAAIRQEFPQVFKLADRVRAMQYEEHGQFSDSSVWEQTGQLLVGYPNFAKEASKGNDDVLAVYSFSAFLAFHMQWRRTRGIYRFDPDLSSSLVDSGYDDKLPIEVLERLPEYCPYIRIDREINGVPMRGFFVYASGSGDRRCLQFSFDRQGTPPEIADALYFERLWYYADSFMVLPLVPGMNVKDAVGSLSNRERDVEFLSWKSTFLSRVLPMVLYLCSEEPDLVGDTVPPRFRNRLVREAIQYDVPRQNREIQVGPRMGSAFRKWKAEQRDRQDSDPTGRHVRPHVRRAHFHGYWTGPLDGERELKMKWLPPIPVNVKDEEELVTTIHPVEMGPT